MPEQDPFREEMHERLQDAIAGLRRQLMRVEIWAAALDGFSKPIPDYQPDSKFLLPGKPHRNR